MPPTASRDINWYRPRVMNRSVAGPGVAAVACNPTPIGNEGGRLTSDSELARPFLSRGGAPVVGAANGSFAPVFAPSSGPLVGAVEGCFPPGLAAAGGTLDGEAEEFWVMSGWTTAEESLPVVSTGIDDALLLARRSTFAGSASVLGLRAISPIRWGSSHVRLCGASPTHGQGGGVTREACQEP